ncbi:hypothetical protein KHQ81_09780 [Mycoplasmatota bacterium]|nr:hypothetical protein KHQ81_09780 [Mycoplasmatota bacterium]
MNEFFYNISFLKKYDLFKININLTYENYLVPVFNRTFNNNKVALKNIYDQIIEYFNHTNIKMTKNDLKLFYNAFKDFNIKLPNPNKINLLDIDFHPSNGLSPKEILFLMYINHKGIHSKKAKYWENEYHLDIDNTIESLIQLGYITTSDYLFNLSKATKKELCAPLDQKNISYSGNKPDILKKVKNSFTETEIKKFFTGLYYKQTIKGEEISNSNQYLTDFHKSYYRYANQLKIEEFYILNKRFKDLDAKDVCKMMVEKKNDEIISDFDWDKFLKEEVKNDNKINNFTEVINKYTINTKAKSQEISEKDFFDVIFKGNNKDMNIIKQAEEKKTYVKQYVKKDLDEAEEAFFKIVNKERNETPKKETKEYKIDSESIEDEFFKVINKNSKKVPKVETNSNPDEAFFKVLNRVKVNEEKNKYDKQNDFYTVKNSLFLRLFLYSSVVSLIIIYYLYQFVFK